MKIATMVGAGALALAAGFFVSAPAKAALTLLVAAGGGGANGAFGPGSGGQIVTSGSDGGSGGAGGTNGSGGGGGAGNADSGGAGGGAGWLSAGGAGAGAASGLGGSSSPTFAGGAGGGVGAAGGFGGGGGAGGNAAGGGGGYSGGGGGGFGGAGGGGGSYVNPVMRDVLETPDFNGTFDLPANGYVVVGLQLFTYTGSVVEYTIPQTTFYFVSAIGAQGGDSFINGPLSGGFGAGVGGEVYLTEGTELDIVVGGAGATSVFGGGGGGSFVWDPTAIPPQPAVPEPSTWAMMLIGFAGLGCAGYRRMKLG